MTFSFPSPKSQKTFPLYDAFSLNFLTPKILHEFYDVLPIGFQSCSQYSNIKCSIAQKVPNKPISLQPFIRIASKNINPQRNTHINPQIIYIPLTVERESGETSWAAEDSIRVTTFPFVMNP